MKIKKQPSVWVRVLFGLLIVGNVIVASYIAWIYFYEIPYVKQVTKEYIDSGTALMVFIKTHGEDLVTCTLLEEALERSERANKAATAFAPYAEDYPLFPLYRQWVRQLRNNAYNELYRQQVFGCDDTEIEKERFKPPQTLIFLYKKSRRYHRRGFFIMLRKTLPSITLCRDTVGAELTKVLVNGVICLLDRINNMVDITIFRTNIASF